MIKERFAKLKDKVDPNEELDKISYILCKEFGWDYETLMKQPIPFVERLLNQMIKVQKEQARSMKANQHGRCK